MCSYGGKIQSRPSDHQLSYIGGDTKILAVDRTVKFSDIIAKLVSLSNRKDAVAISVKYQLPGEDLDSLVSLIDDEDVEHMMVEYDRMQRISAKPARLRIFVFDISAPAAKSGAKEAGSVNPDYLFGFDKEYRPSVGPPTELLQIPSMMPAENQNRAAAQVVYYRVPAVVSGGVYQSGSYPHGVAPANPGDREQPVYNFFPNFHNATGYCGSVENN